MGINTIKLSLSIFNGESDLEAYLASESSCDKIFKSMISPKKRKVAMPWLILKGMLTRRGNMLRGLGMN